MAGIFVLSGVPGDELPLPQFPLSDKIAHFVTYAGLGALLALRVGITAVLRGQPVTQWTKGGWIAPLIGVAYAAFDEFHQGFTPNRDPSVADFIADVAGLSFGWWLARRWDGRKKNQRSEIRSQK